MGNRRRPDPAPCASPHRGRFAPSDAAGLNASDSDVGSRGPVALPPQYLGTPTYPRLTVLIGQQSCIWLDDATNLGGVGQALDGGDKVIRRIGELAGGVRGRPGVYPGDGGYAYIATSQSGARLTACSGPASRWPREHLRDAGWPFVSESRAGGIAVSRRWRPSRPRRRLSDTHRRLPGDPASDYGS